MQPAEDAPKPSHRRIIVLGDSPELPPHKIVASLNKDLAPREPEYKIYKCYHCGFQVAANERPACCPKCNKVSHENQKPKRLKRPNTVFAMGNAGITPSVPVHKGRRARRRQRRSTDAG